MAINDFPIVDDSKVVTKYTDYYINTPDFFIKYIQKEITKRDLPGLTNNRIQGINVTGEHPLVKLTGAVLSAQKQVEVSGLLPAISVVESDENEEIVTLGYSKRTAFIIDEDWVALFKTSHGDIKTRKDEGLLSEYQLDSIAQAVTNAKNPTLNPKGAIIAYLDGFMIRESTFVSLWVESIEERNIVGNTLRSIIYDMRKEMVRRNLKDIRISSSKGLINTNFGRVLNGQETTLDFINVFHTVTVSTDVPTENLLDSTNDIRIYDTVQDAYIDILSSLNVNAKYQGEATQDNLIDQSGTELTQ